MSTQTRFPSLVLLTLAAVSGAILFPACKAGAAHEPPAVAIQAPAQTAEKPATLAGLHNVVTYAPDMVCGGVPEGEEGLHTLAAMGIKTIVSVDGATPDVATAEALGMRYVHLPISYNGITPGRQKELAQAISNLPGPVYMHCHHGKHRSAGALGSAAVLAGKMTPEQAESRMKVSGTAAEYKGLWKAVRESKPMTAAELKADPASFPKVAQVRGMVATMSEIDSVFENVVAAQKAAWTPPKDHPDLVPQKETKRLHALFAQMVADPESQKHDADYQQKLGKTIDVARMLDIAVRANDRSTADTQFALLQKSCKECHKAHRDN
ncbi:MAG: hypothetical protein Q7T30_02215 [Planctomycetota bacterium]|nr:hypothetical protein [Planctomycetota bacterium]